MNLNPLLLPLAIEWVVLVTTLVPIIARGRGNRHPNLAISFLFAALFSAGVACVLALAVAMEFVFQLWRDLNSTPASERDWQHTIQALGVSFAPWLMLATAGVTIALINLKLEPQIQFAREAHPKIAQLLKPVGEFEGVEFFSVEAKALLSFTTKVSGREVIVISSGALESLSESELDAVRWHELGHIRLGHNRLKLVAQLLHSLTPRVAASQTLLVELGRLAEISADRYAARHVDPALLQATRQRFL